MRLRRQIAALFLTGLGLVSFCQRAEATGRRRLEHGTTYYVRHGGNNGNSGLSDTPSGAWADPQFALHWLIDNIDAGKFEVHLKLAGGRWASPASGYICDGRYVGRIPLIIEGQTDTVIDATVNKGHGFWITNDCRIDLRNLTIKSGPGNSLVVINHAVVKFAEITWGPSDFDQIYVSGGAMVEQMGPDRISGSALHHIQASHHGSFRNAGQRTSIEADLQFSGAYAFAEGLGDVTFAPREGQNATIDINGHTVVGFRCIAEMNGIVQAAALGPHFFPGDKDCLAVSGGQVEH